MKNFAIIGGGIGGLTLAVALHRKGIDAKVFEAAPAFKPIGAGLGLAANAVKAYTDIGIDQEVVGAGKKLKRAYIKDHNGRTISQTDIEELTLRFGVLNSFTIHRADLHNILSGLMAPDTLKFGKSVVDVQQDSSGVTLTFSDGSQEQADYVIACDGIHSVIRRKLIPQSLPRYSGYTCWRAVIDNVPTNLNLDETTESWGSGKRFGVVPLTNNRVYWFATFNAKKDDPRMRSATVNDLKTFFSDFHSPVPEILARTKDEQLIWGDIIDLKPVHQFAFGRIVLMGDAAHATTPNLGQGACMAIEDAASLSNALRKYEPEDAFRKFEAHRIARTTSIVNQSRTLGSIAQLENPLLISLRNALLRRVPDGTIHKQLKALYEVSFQP